MFEVDMNLVCRDTPFFLVMEIRGNYTQLLAMPPSNSRMVQVNTPLNVVLEYRKPCD